MAKKKVVEKTIEEKISDMNMELIKALSSGLNTALLTREALNHSMIVMNETARLCKESNNGMRIHRKRYQYLQGKVNDLDNTIVPLIKTLERTLGLTGMNRNLDEVGEIYSDLYDCVEVVKTSEEEIVK